MNAISDNNFPRHDILDVFCVQIEFPGIFNKFPKTLLMEVAMDGWPMVTAVGGWSAAVGGRWL